MPKRGILIIDDEEDFCQLVKRNLELIGDFKVEMATSGEKGIELAKKQKPDLILLDAMMPGMDGFKVLEKLKSDIYTIAVPVIMLTARGDETFKIKAARLCSEAYIIKPIEALELKTKIDEVLRKGGPDNMRIKANED